MDNVPGPGSQSGVKLDCSYAHGVPGRQNRAPGAPGAPGAVGAREKAGRDSTLYEQQVGFSEGWGGWRTRSTRDGALGSKDRVAEVLGSAELREEASWMVTSSAHPPHDYKRAAAPPPPSPWPTMAKTGPRFWSSVFRSSHFTPESQGYHPPYFPSRALKI